jgi:epsilon-lactone hydrolase
VLVSWDGLIEGIGLEYVGEMGVDDPRVSPILGDFTGFRPTYLVSGTRDLLLSDTVRAHRKIRNAGVEADLHVYEGISHGEYLAPFDRPEVMDHYRELGAFLLCHLA